MSFLYPGGPHELGQNFLIDRTIIRTIEHLVARTSGPIVELAAGDGAITLPLSRSARPLTAVEIDPRRARRLHARTPEHVTVHHADILRFELPQYPHVLAGNLPFQLTTAVLRRLLSAQHWQTAILLVQWEVARRRAGVGGASMLTACWWPWYEFSVHARVPARSFRPMPSVDGGLLVMTRRAHPLVIQKKPYQRFVKDVFTSRGRNLPEILVRTGRITYAHVREWAHTHHVSSRSLPKDLTAAQWAALWQYISTTGSRDRPGSAGTARRRKQGGTRRR